MPPVHRFFSLAALVPVLLLGCGKTQSASVRGTVTYNGKPLTTGSVTFHPVTDGPVAIGDIQSDGTYSLQTGTESGLGPGEYRVTVVATGPIPPPTPQNTEPLPELLIPARYADVTTSGIQRTVAAGSNQIDLSLDLE